MYRGFHNPNQLTNQLKLTTSGPNTISSTPVFSPVPFPSIPYTYPSPHFKTLHPGHLSFATYPSMPVTCSFPHSRSVHPGHLFFPSFFFPTPLPLVLPLISTTTFGILRLFLHANFFSLRPFKKRKARRIHELEGASALPILGMNVKADRQCQMLVMKETTSEHHRFWLLSSIFDVHDSRRRCSFFEKKKYCKWVQ